MKYLLFFIAFASVLPLGYILTVQRKDIPQRQYAQKGNEKNQVFHNNL